MADQAAFERRFGCVLTEGYGSSEGGVAISRHAGHPGRLRSAGRQTTSPSSTPTRGRSARRPSSTPPAACSTATEAIGEIVNRAGIGRFEGYYGDEDATAARTRNGWYWTGDLAYRDADGFFYFAGRAAATGCGWTPRTSPPGPIERVLVRHPGVAAVAVYSVPDPRSGDQVMAALELLPGPGRSTPTGSPRFLAAQPDLGTKWAPRSSASPARCPRRPAAR